MRKQTTFSALALIALLSSSTAFACMNHVSQFLPDPARYGPVGQTVFSWLGLAPPPPVYDLQHPYVQNATPGETKLITLEYTKPWFSDDASLEISASQGIELTQNKFTLSERAGSIPIEFRLSKSNGYDKIRFSINGVYQGESVSQSGMIYVRAKS